MVMGSQVVVTDPIFTKIIPIYLLMMHLPVYLFFRQRHGYTFLESLYDYHCLRSPFCNTSLEDKCFTFPSPSFYKHKRI